LEINGKKIDNNIHPVNSFLEELNTDINQEKMFSNIKGKYTSYYSILTGNSYDFKFIAKNNITGYNIKSSPVS
jgi:hypothetical protein